MGITASIEKKMFKKHKLSPKPTIISPLSQKVTSIRFNTLEEAKAAIRAKYDCGTIIGRGASADVYLMTHRVTGKKYACKVIARGGRLNDDKTMLMESYLLQHVNHDNLINLHEMYECPGGMWLMLDHANGGDLWHGLAQETSYSEATVAKYFKQILLGVQYLHQHQIVHRDLKLDNILCDYSTSSPHSESHCTLKITDFGLSTRLTVASLPEHQAQAEAKYRDLQEKGKENAYKYHEYAQRYTEISREEELQYTNKELQILYQLWGTTTYFAPEVHQRAYGYQADIWALGCMLYEMLTGELPLFDTEDDAAPQSPTLKHLLFAHGQRSGSSGSKRSFELSPSYLLLSDAACALLQGMLHPNPKKRLHIDECLQHPFILHGGMEEICRGVFTSRVLPAAHFAIQERVHLSNDYHANIVRDIEEKRMKAKAKQVEQLQQQLPSIVAAVDSAVLKHRVVATTTTTSSNSCASTSPLPSTSCLRTIVV